MFQSITHPEPIREACENAAFLLLFALHLIPAAAFFVISFG
jgi:hypothetical protein